MHKYVLSQYITWYTMMLIYILILLFDVVCGGYAILTIVATPSPCACFACVLLRCFKTKPRLFFHHTYMLCGMYDHTAPSPPRSERCQSRRIDHRRWYWIQQRRRRFLRKIVASAKRTSSPISSRWRAMPWTLRSWTVSAT